MHRFEKRENCKRNWYVQKLHIPKNLVAGKGGFTINNTFTMIVILTTERRKNLIRNNEEIFHFVQDDKSYI